MCFGGGGSTPSVPVVQQIPAAPAAVEQENQATASADKAEAKTKQYAGMGSTLLTNPLGVTGAATTQKKTLLGE